MTPEEKLAKARQLIIEATRETRARKKAAVNGQICKCSHRHDDHGISVSVNYSAGPCMVAGCGRMWFRGS